MKMLSVILDPHYTAEDAILWDPENDSVLRLFEDMVSGKELPLKMAVKAVSGISTALAVTIFLDRGLLLYGRTTSLVQSIDFLERLGPQFLAHLDPEIGLFFRLLGAHLPTDSSFGKEESIHRLESAKTWITEYIHEGTFPSLGADWPTPRVLDIGTNGFVIAETTSKRLSLFENWISLYRLGFLRGILVSPPEHDRRRVLVARKTNLVNFDLQQATKLLNEVEISLGELPTWKVDTTSCWLSGPETGTLLLIQDLAQILLRV